MFVWLRPRTLRPPSLSLPSLSLFIEPENSLFLALLFSNTIATKP